MKAVIICLLFMTIISCRKKKNIPFTDKELEFVSYTPDQKQIKFIDSTGAISTLFQTYYDRSFRVVSGLFNTSDYYESYEVSYTSRDTTGQIRNGQLIISLNGFSSYTPANLDLYFYDYSGAFKPDSLYKDTRTFSINNKNYTDVYKLKMRNDSTIVYYNKQYGLIQMVYKNGKTITRTE